MKVGRLRNLSQALDQGRIEPVYFLFGPETYVREQAERKIADKALGDTLIRDFDDFSFSLIRGSARKAIVEAETFPMLSKRRVVRMTGFEKLKESEEQILIDYLERPVATSVVIFTTAGIDKRKKLTKALLQTAAFEFSPTTDIERAAWARLHLKGLKTEIDAKALDNLIEQVGDDVTKLPYELEKLSVAALPSGRITTELVDGLIGRSRELMNWELTDHMLSRNRARAVKTLQHLLDDGAPPVMLIGLIASTYRRMALAHALHSKGAPPKEIFRQVPMPPFKQSSYLQMLSRVDGRKLARQMVRIAEADLGIKTSKATPRMQVELLVTELTN